MDKYGFISVVFLVTCVVSASNANNSSVERIQQNQSPVGPTDLLVKIENNNNHKIVVNNQEDPNDCSRYVGHELKTKMRWLETAALKKNLINFGPQKRILYIKSLDCYEVVELADRLGQEGRTELCRNINENEAREFFDVFDKSIASIDLNFTGKFFIGCAMTCVCVGVAVGAMSTADATQKMENTHRALLLRQLKMIRERAQ